MDVTTMKIKFATTHMEEQRIRQEKTQCKDEARRLEQWYQFKMQLSNAMHRSLESEP